jgi:hypothetical protein
MPYVVSGGLQRLGFNSFTSKGIKIHSIKDSTPWQRAEVYLADHTFICALEPNAHLTHDISVQFVNEYPALVINDNICHQQGTYPYNFFINFLQEDKQEMREGKQEMQEDKQEMREGKQEMREGKQEEQVNDFITVTEVPLKRFIMNKIDLMSLN